MVILYFYWSRLEDQSTSYTNVCVCVIMCSNCYHCWHTWWWCRKQKQRSGRSVGTRHATPYTRRSTMRALTSSCGQQWSPARMNHMNHGGGGGGEASGYVNVARLEWASLRWWCSAPRAIRNAPSLHGFCSLLAYKSLSRMCAVWVCLWSALLWAPLVPTQHNTTQWC